MTEAEKLSVSNTVQGGAELGTDVRDTSMVKLEVQQKSMENNQKCLVVTDKKEAYSEQSVIPNAEPEQANPMSYKAAAASKSNGVVTAGRVKLMITCSG